MSCDAGSHHVSGGDQRLAVDVQGALVDEAGVPVADREVVGVGDVAYLVRRSRSISSCFCAMSAGRSTPSALVGTIGNGLVSAGTAGRRRRAGSCSARSRVQAGSPERPVLPRGLALRGSDDLPHTLGDAAVAVGQAHPVPFGGPGRIGPLLEHLA